MTWGNKSNYNTTYLDEATDSPADARPELKNAVDELTNVIDGLNTAGGAAKLDASTTKVIADSGVQATTDLTLTPGSGKSVNIENILNLKPQTVAELNAVTAAEGDIAYCSNGNAGADCLAVYTSAGAWKVLAISSTTISAS
tara:strand:+ start:8158 stop:8583 length:426 start_codon:yes stop_codon:yes gene_type:complete